MEDTRRKKCKKQGRSEDGKRGEKGGEGEGEGRKGNLNRGHHVCYPSESAPRRAITKVIVLIERRIGSVVDFSEMRAPLGGSPMERDIVA